MRDVDRSRRPRPTAALLAPVGGAIAVLVLVEVAIRRSGTDPAVLPAPSDVAQALWRSRSLLAGATGTTLEEVLSGLGSAIVVGSAAALAMHRFRWLRRALHPWLVASQAVPTPALAVPLALALGYTLATRTVVVALVAFLPLTVAALDGLGRADRELLDLYRSFGAGPWRIAWEVELPGALPAFFSGLRVAAAFSVVGAVFGEWVGSSDGLGYLMLTAGIATDRVFACIVVLAAVGITLVGAVTVVERLATPWRR